MKKLWFTAKELAGLEGLPTSPQGINLMARREGWKNRRKRGVQGIRSDSQTVSRVYWFLYIGFGSRRG